MLASLLFAVVTLAHIWFISAGRMTAWPEYGSYYNKLVDGYFNGHLYLRLAPAPELLALPDPYDPAANEKYKLGDALLYRGRYYLYWGPAPALLLAPVKAVTGDVVIGDENLVFFFTLGTVGFATLLLLRVRERLFPEQPWWVVGFGVAAMGLCAPITFTLARASVYEAAIMGGQCFLMAGVYFAIAGLDGEASPGARDRCLLLAGACWAFAVGSRPSLAIAVTALALLALWRLWRIGPSLPLTRPRARRFVSLHLPAACLGLPLLAGAAGMGWYNWARFGAWNDFGMHYQLAGINVHALADSTMMNWRYVVPNLLRYLFEWGRWGPAFPFVHARNQTLRLLVRFNLPPEYGNEAVAGIVWSAPFLLLAVVPIVAAMRRRRRRAEQEQADARWLVACLTAAAGLAAVPPLRLFGSTMRYLDDFVPMLAVLATLGVWQLLRAAGESRVRRRIVIDVAGLLLAVTVIFGLLLGLSGYYNHFLTYNEPLFRRLCELRF